MKYTLRDYQQEASDLAVNFFTDKKKTKNGIIVLPTGCHAKGTLIIMADGTRQKVEDIRVGDTLLGTDGYRTVLELHHGTDEMYRIKPIKGRPFVVNGGHILSLLSTPIHSERRYVEMSVKEYLLQNDTFKSQYKLHRLPRAFFSDAKRLPLDPYYMGLFLGDGSSAPNGTNINITTRHPEVRDFLLEYSQQLGMNFRSSTKEDSKASSYFIVKQPYEKHNYINEAIRSLGLAGHTAVRKFIPECYLTAPFEKRLQLAAGIFDTDCFYDSRNNCIEYGTKSLELMWDVIFLMRSLGLFCGNISEKVVNGVLYFRVCITGDLNTIPSRVLCRQGCERKQRKSIYVTGFEVEPVGVGEYYGFTLDGNHLYCDDQFFIHHNSGKSMVIADIANRLDGNTIVFQPSVEILEQNFEKLHDVYGYEDCGIYSASKNAKDIKKVTFATIGSVKNKAELFSDFKNIIIDECFPKDVKVYLADESTMAIGRLNDKFKAGEKLPDVMAFDEKTGTFKPGKILAVKETGIKTVYKTRFYNGLYIQSTNNHPFLTPFGWKPAGELQPGDAVISKHCAPPYFRNVHAEPDFQHFLIGDLLSGAKLYSHRDNIVKMRGSIDGSMAYKKFKFKAYGSYNSQYKNCRSSMVPDFYFKADLSPMNLAKHLTPKSIAAMYINNGSGFDIRLKLEDEVLEMVITRMFMMGIIAERTEKGITITSPTRFFELCGQYIPLFVKRRVPAQYKCYIGSYEWVFYGTDSGVAVVSERKYESNRRVFNLEVDKFHTYMVNPRSVKGFTASPIVCHNCHLVNPEEGMYKNFIQAMRGAKVVGLTATPYRLYSYNDFGCMLKFITRIRGSIFKEVFYTMQVKDALERGYLANVRYFDCSPKEWNDKNLERNSTGRDFTDESVKKEYSRVNMEVEVLKIVHRLRHPKSGIKRNGILVFTKFVEESERLSKNTPNSAVVSGKTPKKERKKILEDFKNGKIEVIYNCSTLVVGFDHPALDTVVFARPTMSLAVYYQALGRLIRPYKDKESWFVDMCGNIPKFGHVEDLKVIETKKGHAVVNKDGFLTNRYMGGVENPKPYNSSEAKEERIKKWCEEHGYPYRTPEERKERDKARKERDIEKARQHLLPYPDELNIFQTMKNIEYEKTHAV